MIASPISLSILSLGKDGSTEIPTPLAMTMRTTL